MRVERKDDEPIVPFTAPKIRFERQITERQGLEVASKFKPFLEQVEGVRRAYVVWAFYGEETSHSPVLAIVADIAHKDNILQAVSYVSQTQFPAGAGFYIDTCFLTERQEQQVKLIAEPFLSH